jgi:hypothetical protein
MEENRVKRFDWLPSQMPGVARLVREKRAEFGDEHVNRCWRRGVLEGQPGWFFAREATLAVGTPWDTPEMANFAAANITSTQALLMIRHPVVERETPGRADGTH